MLTINVKIKSTLQQATKAHRVVEVYLYSFFYLGVRWGGWSTPRSGRLTPGKYNRYPLYRRLGGAPRPVWTGTENLAPPPIGIRSPDRPALSELLYRLRYPGPHQTPVYVSLLPMHATCTTHTTFFDFITLIISAKECKLRSSSLCNFLSPPVPLSFPIGSKNSPQDPVFKYLHSRLFHERSNPYNTN